jgi:cytochrome c oxidase subunit III
MATIVNPPKIEPPTTDPPQKDPLRKEPPKVDPPSKESPKIDPPARSDEPAAKFLKFSNGDGKGSHPLPDDRVTKQKPLPPPGSTAIWVGIAAICMMIAAFTSALVVRQGGAPDWRHLQLPRVLYLDTLILVLSSVTLEIASRHIAAFMGARNEVRTAQSMRVSTPTFWLYATLVLGLLFVSGQYLAWLQLRAQGLYLATTPNSSFFYLFTVVHALHVLGGLLGLFYVATKLQRGILRRSTLYAATRYWHFMGALWLYLLFLLWSRI